MTQQQKQYIEQNIDLIENNRWEEFFEPAPVGLGSVLYEAGIDFMTKMRKIPDWVFFGSNIEDMAIPDGVTTVGYAAFAGCKNLTSIIIPESVTSIGYEAFSHCTSLTSINIPESVTSISSLAFFYCTSLKSITIPNNVNSIEEGAFADLGSDVIINFNGTKEQWKNIYNSKAFTNTYFIVNCLDGTIHKKKR